MNFRLDPPRGKPMRAAVVLVSKKDDAGLHIHKLEYVEPGDVKNAIECFRKLRTLSAKMCPSNTAKRSEFHGCQENPKRCRTLQQTPTDASLH